MTKIKPTISVAIAVFNESAFIESCLNAVYTWVNEIVIVDGQSTDNTVELIKKRFPKTKIISTTNKPNFHINKQLAIDNCHSDWILQLDADEVVSAQLKQEILKTINSTNFSGFWIKRKNYFLGKFLTKGGVYPDPTIRLYRQGKGKLPCIDVHEQAIIDGQIGSLNHDLLHYSDQSFERYLNRNNRYTSLISNQLPQNLELNFLTFIQYFLILPTYWFLKTYFRHRGYVDGFPGFVFSWYSSLRFPIAFIKLYEKKHQ